MTTFFAIMIIFANVNFAYSFSLKKNASDTEIEQVKQDKEEKQAIKEAKKLAKQQAKDEKKALKQQAKEEKNALKIQKKEEIAAQKEAKKLAKQQAQEEKRALKQQAKEEKKLAKQKKNNVEEISEDQEAEEPNISESEQSVTDTKADKRAAKKLAKQKAKEEKKALKQHAKEEKQALKEAERQAKAKLKKEKKKRSALSMFLNPNLDIFEVRASHILVKKRKDAVAIRNDIIRGDITFEEAAQKYSLCPSGQFGGDLGYFNRRKMEQLFADTAFDLKIGEISKPVGTKFGWHIIKTTDKR